MKYIFWGTPQFAAVILQQLIDAGMAPALVVTNPDKPVGRNQEILPSPVKRVSDKHQIPTLQPTNLEELRSRRQKLSIADVFVVVAYGKIIPKNILEIPRLGAVNVHPSLLPMRRGPTPIQSAILNGDEKTGVTLMLLDEEVDHGPILAQRESGSQLSTVNSQLLGESLAKLGAEMLIETLPKYVKGDITAREQKHEQATFTKKFTTEDARVPYEDLQRAITMTNDDDYDTAVRIDRMIRALNPEPGVWTRTTEEQVLGLPKNKRVKLLEAEMRDGCLILLRVQVEGKDPRTPTQSLGRPSG